MNTSLFTKNKKVYFVTNVQDNFFVRCGKFSGYNDELQSYFVRVGDEIYITGSGDIFLELTEATKEALDRANRLLDITKEQSADRAEQIVKLQEDIASIKNALFDTRGECLTLRNWASKRLIKPFKGRDD